jgi:hypothetical protein
VSVGRSPAHARFWFLTSDRRILSGAIAQLGERLLCKQEVVGSIPSGSTNSIRRSCQEPNFRKVGLRRLARIISHREEGIDQRLPHSRKTHVLWRTSPTEVGEANRFRCRVNLDENLVLTSVSVRKDGH